MNFSRWRQKPKWLARLLAMPVPEPAQQAARILGIQRNIILPVRVLVAASVMYYLFYARLQVFSDSASAFSVQSVIVETLQGYFIFYVLFNAAAAALMFLRRLPPGFVPWMVFTVGLVDGVLLAGLTLETNGFTSPLFWVYPGLIVLNALSIPLATPQIVLNLALSAFFLASGIGHIRVQQVGGGGTMYRGEALRIRASSAKLLGTDITNLVSFAARLTQPAVSDPVARLVAMQLQTDTSNRLAHFGGKDAGMEGTKLKNALAQDLNRLIQGNSIYDPRLFAGVKLSSGTSNLLQQRIKEPDRDTDLLNRDLLLDAFPKEIHRKSTAGFMTGQPTAGPPGPEIESEPFVLRLIILWLLTVSCYGVQLLSFRQRLAEEEEGKTAARNDELKAAGRLAAEIAHQLKNPLGIMNNALYTLQKGLREGKTEFTLQIEIIQEEIDRSDRILTQLMGYAQLSEGRVERINLADELDHAVNEVLPPGANYTTRIDRHYALDLPDMLMQRSHLAVVIVNLLQNAREAMNGRGVIQIHARCRGESNLEVIIADDGPGIAPDKIDRIFEAYFTSKLKGTGLGLAIVKHNVELYGGTVRVESELGKGARFVLSFPAKTFIKTS